jgi:alkylation response protein AidB-like acyl-CoA dehydrogenase
MDDLHHEVRAWCAAHVPSGWRREQAGVDHDQYLLFQRWWLTELDSGGYAVPHWPLEWGGGYSLAEQAVIYEELARADAPRLGLFFVALHHAAATLLGAGTDAQRDRHLPAIRAGEVWCQGFSEPGAGSDLASLHTRAERRHDVYVVNGQKIWASGAQDASWCLLLARTDPSAPKHRGISYLIMDMRSPGVMVRPIKQITGDEHFCEIFLTDVEIPVANLIGAENDGWRVAQGTLNTERGATMIELAERLALGYRWLVRLARESDPGSELVESRLSRLGSEMQALRLLTRRALAESDGRDYTASASVVKLFYSELLQRVMDFGVQLSGLAGHESTIRPLSSGWESGLWLRDFIGSWEWTIPGGTSEIQRNIIAERSLGLPRERSA